MGVEIKVEYLTKSFGKQLIWGDVTLTVPAGEICVMLGPSGTGKSVFLKTLIGLLKPDQGSIIIEGTDLATCSEKELYEIRKLFGVLFQDGAMEAPATSVLDEICRKLEAEARHPATSMALVQWWWRVRVPLVTFAKLIAHAQTNVQLHNRRKAGQRPPADLSAGADAVLSYWALELAEWAK